MKGIILAAGKGTRLYPITIPVCKPLIPVYDKPLVYYPLATLISAGIKDILIIVPPSETDEFEKLLGNGSAFGIKINYAIQTVPKGIADAFIIAEDFIGCDDVCLILGDNIFYSDNLNEKLTASFNGKGANVFGVYCEDPRPFGVIEFDKKGKVLGIEEKPISPKSHYIIPGLYFYDNDVVEIAKNITPSARGELEITDVNKEYLKKGLLYAQVLKGNVVWFDAGTPDSILNASISIKALKSKHVYVGSPELEAFEKGYINKEKLQSSAAKYPSKYGELLMELSDNSEKK